MTYEAVIGLEIHVELNTQTKLFCDCPNRPGDAPNVNICPVCLWLPGALPRLSHEVLEKAVAACLGLDCTIQPESAFDQKVYYYPDLPKGYQLSQHHKPLARNGWLNILVDGRKESRRLGIQHIHLEEDVAKLLHETEGRTPISLVDFNRAGAPLIEIVSEPDMRSPEEAMEFLKELRARVRYTGASECSLEKGSMRVDANISIRPRGSCALNTKVEVKNMNSIQNVGDAIAYEVKRQSECLEKNEPVLLHTRLWDPEKRMTAPMRGKFSGPCVPDPSVPQIVIDDAWLAEQKAKLPEMPVQKVKRFMESFGLAREEALIMSQERALSEFFEKAVQDYPHPRKTANWITAHLMPALKEQGKTINGVFLTSERFKSLLCMLDRDEINANAAKEVLHRLLDEDKSPEKIVEEQGYRQLSDTDTLEKIVESILKENPSGIQDYQSGNMKVLGFFMGQAMKITQGKANPRVLKELFVKRL